jgi:hypothetical protein
LSEVLRFGSWYFHGTFKHEWLETRLQADGKYYFSCTDFDAEALYVLLLTMHKEAFYRFDNDYYETDLFPIADSLDTFVGITEIIDYYQMLPASCLIRRSSTHWFDQFRCNSLWGDWDLPEEYESEIMMWWCLAQNFEPLSKNGDLLQDAVKRVISKYARGLLENFGWPIRRQQLEEVEHWREWSAAYA